MLAPGPLHHKNMSTPADRSHIDTEQRNDLSVAIDQADIGDCLAIMDAANRQVFTAVEAARPALSNFLQDIEDDFINGGRLIYLGAGTSGRLGVLDASEAPPTFCVPTDRIIGIIAGGDKSLRTSSEGMEDDPNGARTELEKLTLTDKDTVLGIAAGGTTPYVRGAFAIAKELGNAHTGFISCSQVTPPAGLDHMIYCPSGAEVITGSTRMKAGTACKLLLNHISTCLMIRSGRVYQNLMVDVKASNEKLRDRAARIISTLCSVSREQAFTLLDAADGQCKVAVLMHKQQCDADTAQALLDQHHGHLGPCLND